MIRAKLTSGNDTGNAAIFQTSSFTPNANRLVLAFVASVTPSGAANSPTLSGNNLTWEKVHEATTSNTNDFKITCFRAMSSTPSAGTLAINFGGQQQDCCTWAVFEYDGVDTTGTNGSNAIVQKSEKRATGQSLSAALDSPVAGSTENRTVAALLLDTKRTVTAGSGFAEIDSQQPTGGGRTCLLQAQESTAANPVQQSGWSWAGGASAAAIVLELKDAVDGEPTSFEDELAKNFAPILFLHKEEKLVPVNAQRYVEQAAMWQTKATAPIDDKNSWTKVFSAGDISTDLNDVRCLDGLGAGLDKFLELGGWKDKAETPEPLVTPTSTNLYANRAQIEKIYNGADPLMTPWYHAEVLDIKAMKALSSQAATASPDYTPLIERIDRNFPNARLLNYYLFFPDHVQSVGGVLPTDSSPCDNIEAKEVSCHAADWQCISLLLHSDTPDKADSYVPAYIGLTGLLPAWTKADDGSVVYVPHEFDGDKQTVMKLAEWQPTTGPTSGLPATIGTHPKLFVALGSHSLYVSPAGAQSLHAYQPGDWPDYCGKRDTPRPTEPPPSGDPDDPYGSDEGWFGDLLAALGKFLAGLGTGGAPGAVIASLAIGEEGGVGNPLGYPIPTDIIGDTPTPDATPPITPIDAITIRPAATPVPEEGAVQTWKSKQQADQDGRKYDYLVDRDKQMWWPHPDNEHGYYGRWGQQVAADPMGRRSGPHFPNYVRMFLAALESGLRGPGPTPDFRMDP